MLSYQHDYHAGNFADTHKHLSLRLIFETLLKKDKPFCYIDCHAGSGQYDLQAEKSHKNAEHERGINILCRNSPANMNAEARATLKTYLRAVADINPNQQLRYYPGSPRFAQQWLRPQDKAILLELHPQAQSNLRRHFSKDERFNLHARDCYEGLPALVPPPQIKRGLVLLDPSYEVKDEYSKVVSLLSRAHQRWSTAIYMIWYPILRAGRHRQLISILKKSGLTNILISELFVADKVEEPNLVNSGLMGSGVAIINAPWKIDQALLQLMPNVAETLSPGAGKASVLWLKN